MAYLQLVKGNRPGQRFHLRGERNVLGRHPSCEIVLDDSLVSRQHAQISNRRGEFFLEDLRSRNRTFLNGIAIGGKTQLIDADEVKIGEVVFQFCDALASVPAGSGTDEMPMLAGTVGPAEPNPEGAINQKVTAPDVAKDPDPSSTVMFSFDAKSAPSMRLGVKPEAKLLRHPRDRECRVKHARARRRAAHFAQRACLRSFPRWIPVRSCSPSGMTTRRW